MPILTMQAILAGPAKEHAHERMVPTPELALSHSDAFVELEKVTVTYGRAERAIYALAETSLRVAPGDFVALVGPSGCGKSTILKLVTGLIGASTGLVYVSGREVGAEPMRVGMAFQNPTLLPWMTIRDNVMLPLKIVPPFRSEFRAKRKTEFRDRPRRCWRRSASRLWRQVSLAAVRRMMQRALCRALVHDPQLLMLDEPFGALDQFTREELWAIMQDLWQSRRPTVLLVTHDLKEAGYLGEPHLRHAGAAGRISTTAWCRSRARAPSR